MRTTLVSGMAIPALTLGTMTFGTPVGQAEAIRIVHHAAELDINHIDTANMYEGYARVAGSAGGVAEEIVGAAVKGQRSRYLIATKLGMKVGQGPLDEMTAPAAIHEQLTRSLRRMGTDYVDIYYLHRFDPATAPEDIASAMAREMKEGRIRAWGISNYSAEQLSALVTAASLVGAPAPAFCQPPLSLLKQDALSELIPVCVAHHIAVVPYQVLQGGLLTGKYQRGLPPPEGSRAQEKPDWVAELSDAEYAQLEDYAQKAASLGFIMSQYAVRWVLEQPGVVSAILGAKRPSQLDEIVLVAQ